MDGPGWTDGAKPKDRRSAPEASAGSGLEGEEGKPKKPPPSPRRRDRPGTFRQCGRELFQTFEELLPRKHRAAYQAHPSYKVALEQGLVPLEEPSLDEAEGGGPEPQLPYQERGCCPLQVPQEEGG